MYAKFCIVFKSYTGKPLKRTKLEHYILPQYCLNVSFKVIHRYFKFLIDFVCNLWQTSKLIFSIP